jgi:uncharacterized protein YbjT (DUF2867 family)
MILVSGATGTIGSELVRRLSEAGEEVRVLVRSPEKAAMFEGSGVEVAEGDFARPETLDAALRGAKKAFLLSSIAPNQAELQGNFVEAALRAGVEHVVKSSTMGAAPDAQESFARYHWETEQRIKESGVAYTILQPNFFYQNFSNLYAYPIRNEGALYLPLKGAKVGMVDTRDIAAVAAVALTEERHEGQTYVLTGPEVLTMNEVVERLSAAIGKRVDYVDTPPEVFRQNLLRVGLPESMADDVTDLFVPLSEGESAVVTGTVEEVTGREPIPFDRYASDYAEAFVDQRASQG